MARSAIAFSAATWFAPTAARSSRISASSSRTWVTVGAGIDRISAARTVWSAANRSALAAVARRSGDLRRAGLLPRVIHEGGHQLLTHVATKLHWMSPRMSRAAVVLTWIVR